MNRKHQTGERVVGVAHRSARYPEIPHKTLDKWQSIVDIMAEILRVRTAVIMQVVDSLVEIVRVSSAPEPPFRRGDQRPLMGLFCEQVARTKRKVSIPNALADNRWSNCPSVKMGFVSYLGYPLLWPDGELYGTLCVLHTEKGQYDESQEKLIGLFKDTIEDHLRLIWDRHVGHLALKQSQTYYGMLFENANDAIFTMEGERFISCNSKALEMFGCTKEQIIGRTPYDIFSPEYQPDGRSSREKATEKIEGVLAGEPQCFGWTHLRYDGTAFETEVSLSRIELPNAILVQAIVRDLTLRKQTENELERTRALLFAAIENSPAGILIADAPDVRIKVANPAALGIRGKTNVKLTGIPVELHPKHWQTFYPDGRPYKGEDLPLSRAVLKGETIDNEEVIIVRGDGEQRWVLANAAPVRDREGNIVAGVVVFPDITERKNLEQRQMEHQEQLVHVSRLSTVGEMASELAHELNQPLTAIVGSAQACARLLEDIKAGGAEVERLSRSLDLIWRQCDRAVEIVGRVKDFVRKRRTHRTPVDMDELIEETIRFADADIRHSDTKVELELDELPKVSADKIQIEQVLLNLIRNAVEAMGETAREKRHITIETHMRDKGTVEVAVSDTGPGFNGSKIDKLFEPFYTTKPEGLGIGLSICHSIIEDHEGKLTAERNADCGATFRFTLPAVSQ